jgi:hypothetical protein
MVTLHAADVEIEGRITAAASLPESLRLVFQYAGGRDLTNRWYAPVDADGAYHVVLGTPEEESDVCVRAEAANRDETVISSALNSVPVRCISVSRGLQRVDFTDVDLPPAIVRVEIPALPQASFGSFLELVVDDQRAATFKPLRGFVGQALVGYGRHTVSVVRHDSKIVLATGTISIDPDNRSALVTLRLSDVQ